MVCVVVLDTLYSVVFLWFFYAFSVQRRAIRMCDHIWERWPNRPGCMLRVYLSLLYELESVLAYFAFGSLLFYFIVTEWKGQEGCYM